MKESKNPLVSIKCLVYNQESYLRQCLDGFVMQKTNFAFEAIVHDDASTDGSAAIIREYAEKYPNIIKPIYETENQYSKKDGSLGRIMNAAIHPNVKYVAICEGDDYWIDPYKLQKQVDLLERNPDCGLVCANHYVQQGEVITTQPARDPTTYPKDGLMLECLIKCNNIATLTICYRLSIYKKFEKHLWDKIDRSLFLCFASCSKIYFINDCVAVYRILPESASHSQSYYSLLRSYEGFTKCTLDTLVYLGVSQKLKNVFLIPRTKYLFFLAVKSKAYSKAVKYFSFLLRHFSWFK